MDKYEYKLRLEEIRTLNRKGRFQEAAQVADTIDWKKVRNISTLGIISDVYKINRRFDDAKAMLMLANEKSPQNRRLIYALCDLTIKMGQVVEAVEFYKEFVQLAPNDNSKYILLYKIYEAQDISLEERIAVLKEYKKREYSEKWAYELAFLYHRVGLATECVEECDQLILWFGEGKYVTKAMELKKLYVQLSPAQQQAYERQFGGGTVQPEQVQEEKQQEQEPSAEKAAEEELEIHVKPMDMSQYSTINLQAELAGHMREVLEPAPEQEEQPQDKAVVSPMGKPGYGGDDAEYQEDVSQVMRESEKWDAQATGQLEPEHHKESGQPEAAAEAARQAAAAEAARQAAAAEAARQAAAAETARQAAAAEAARQAAAVTQRPGGSTAGMEELLAQEYDGQISLALSEEKVVEKQITGQMSFEDVRAEWERIKKVNEAKRRQETREWMLQQTGSLFEEFDQDSRNGILERLQREEALPVENVQRGRLEDPSALTEVEELEELDEIEELEELEEAAFAARPALTQPVQPTPVNAAARAVMAAQGALGEGGNPVRPAAQSGGQSVQAEAAQSGTQTVQTQAVQSGTQTVETQTAPSEAQPVETQAAPSEAQPVETEAAQSEARSAETDAAQLKTPPTETESAQSGQTAESHTGALHARISEQQLEEHVRNMTKEEKKLFAPFVPTKGAMRQLVRALDMISLSAYTGNVIITGAPGSDMMKLAQNMIRVVRASDENFSGKIAKISGELLNTQNAEAVVAKIANGALIVEKAGKLSGEGAENLAKALNQEHTGIIVLMLDNKRAIGRLADRNPRLAACFTARFDIAALDSATLVKYGCQYAYTQEYSIDELGRLALHTRIEDLQTSTHAVTVEEVREIVDEAIDHANRKTFGHFLDILLRKRYDEDDMIVLKEKDFI